MTQARYSPDHAETVPTPTSGATDVSPGASGHVGSRSAISHAPGRRSARTWAAPVAAGPLRSTVTVPGSKSLTNRELLLAALADAPSRLTAPLHSDDSARMVEALRGV